jgi:sulfoxide reductase heme-binding subunit YedZ
MLALASTSTNWSIRRLGGRRWQALHRLIYVAAVAGVLHYWWLVKADVRNPAAYAVVVGILLTYRVVVWARRRAAVPVRPAAARTDSIRST